MSAFGQAVPHSQFIKSSSIVVSTNQSAIEDYYVARAAEYDEVYRKPERQPDLRSIEKWLPPLLANRRVLEIACGTGYWTQIIAPTAERVVAIDSSIGSLTSLEARFRPVRSRFTSLTPTNSPRKVGSARRRLQAPGFRICLSINGKSSWAVYAQCWPHVRRSCCWIIALYQVAIRSSLKQTPTAIPFKLGGLKTGQRIAFSRTSRRNPTFIQLFTDWEPTGSTLSGNASGHFSLRPSARQYEPRLVPRS
jgi:hypothetical protein